MSTNFSEKVKQRNGSSTLLQIVLIQWWWAEMVLNEN